MYRNGQSVYICTCGVVEYCTSENVTPPWALNNKSNLKYLRIICDRSKEVPKINIKSTKAVGHKRVNVGVRYLFFNVTDF